jgi:hypothetical protein
MNDEYNYRTVGFDVFLNRGVLSDGETEDEISLRSPQISATSLVPGITKSQDGKLTINWAEEQIIITDGARNRVEIGKIPGTEEYGVRIYDAFGQEVFSSAGRLQTEGLEDEAVTTTKILSLAADKITTGTLTALADIGTGSGGSYVRLDGQNNRIIVNDGSNPRIVIGNV